MNATENTKTLWESTNMTHKYNRHSNQYSTRDPRGLYLMLATVATGVALWTYGEVRIIKSTVPFSPLGTMSVQAQESAVEVATEPQTIEEYITYKFGKDSESALKIAKCESMRDGKIQPDLIGDTHLMSMNNGEMVGDSIGVFQIRTGGKGWNRAKANGMTAEEFRTKLKDFKYNIDYAKNVYDNAKGFSPWYNCMVKEGL